MSKSRAFHHHHHKPIIDSSESGFSNTLLRIAVAQICQSVGFKGAQNPALEILTDIAARYLKAVAKSGAAAANRHGRTESNLPDIIVALEDLESGRGFSGASELLTAHDSGVVKDVIRFVEYGKEIPFAQPLPPWRRKRFCQNSSASGGVDNGRWYDEMGKLRHVPNWLPPPPMVAGHEEKIDTVGWRCLNGEVEKEGDMVQNEMIEKDMGKKPANKRLIELEKKRGKVRFKLVGGIGGGIGKSNKFNKFLNLSLIRSRKVISS